MTPLIVTTLMCNVLVLNYHEIIENETESNEINNKFSVYKSDFIKQLDLIQSKGIPIVSVSDWIQDKIDADFAVVLTFDNGLLSNYTQVFPELQKREIKATFFPVLSFIGEENHLSWNHLKEMVNAGFELGSNSVLNENMRTIGKQACKFELELSKHILQKKTGATIDFFAPPLGNYSRRTLKTAYAVGYKKVFSTQAKINHNHDHFVLHRWSLKQKTSLDAISRILEKGLNLKNKKNILPTFSIQFSKSFGIDFVNKTHAIFYNLIKKY